MEALNGLTTETLLQWLANAQETYASCGGHHKASMNQQRVKEYKEELVKRGVEIPDNKKLYEVGIFNGDGTY